MLRRPAAWIGVLTAIAVTFLLAFGLTESVELPVRDLALRMLPVRPAAATTVVAIDEKSIRALGRWPWPRPVLAQIVDRIADSGARAVVLDILLTESAPGDERLAQALRRLPSIAVSVLDEDGLWHLPAPMISAAATPAHGNFELDHDGIVRRFASTKQSGKRALTAVSVEAASIATSRAVPVGRSIAPMFRTHPRSIPVVSAADLLRDPVAASRVRGKLVFVGSTAQAVGDRVLTPVSTRLPEPGVTVHAAAAESVIRGEEVREMAPIAAGCLGGLLVGVVIRSRARRRITLSIAASLIVVIAGGGLLLLASTGIAAPFIMLLLCDLTATACVESIRMTVALRQSDATVTRLAAGREHEAESKRVLAHELKTPLASMRGLSQLLGGFELTDVERRRVASLLEAEAGKLQSLVTGLLDLEKLPLRDFDASTNVIDLGDIVRMRIEFLKASTDRELIASIAPRLSVRADAALIERVVDNLVGNALKYAPGWSPVTITARSSGATAVIEVEDRGPGIAEADRERVFDRFFRGSSAAGTQGLGLGLSLVAEVARWHGGSVIVEGADGGGSVFRFVLPLVPAAAKAGGM
jgi:signal transduction histidine kinase